VVQNEVEGDARCGRGFWERALELDGGEIWEARIGGNPSGARDGGKKIEVGGGRAGDWRRERRVGRGFGIGRVRGVSGPIFPRIGFFLARWA
jgi:hypothetical protein